MYYLFIAVIKIPHINNLRQGLFWLTISEDSVHGLLAPCIGSEHHGSVSMWYRRALLHLIVHSKQRLRVSERKKSVARYNLQRPASSDLLPTARPHSSSFYNLPNSAINWGPSVQTHEPVGTFYIQIITFHLYPQKAHGHLIMQNTFSPSPKS
jgi:hypothetical protein